MKDVFIYFWAICTVIAHPIKSTRYLRGEYDNNRNNHRDRSSGLRLTQLRGHK